MPIIPPRIEHILNILLKDSAPISIRELSEKLSVSERTVFRELKNIDLILKPYYLHIDTIIGKGIILAGNNENKQRLKQELESNKNYEPSSKDERRYKLILLLLNSMQIEKLVYYANIMGVSEATVSNDLDWIEVWLIKYNIRILRKQSFGIQIVAKELNIRRALIAILKLKNNFNLDIRYFNLNKISFHDKKVLEKLFEEPEKFIDVAIDSLINWATPESKKYLALYIKISIFRISSGLYVNEVVLENSFISIARKMSDIIYQNLNIRLSENELSALTIEISACRNNTTSIPKINKASKKNICLEELVYKMIDIFDPKISSILKLDEDLINGLIFHIKSAIVRIENGIELEDPLYDEISAKYTDLMHKSRRVFKLIYCAVKNNIFNPINNIESEEKSIILDQDNIKVSEHEVSFLAVHFGAALHRIEENNLKKVKMKIAIICITGIGTSYMLASQIRKHFQYDAIIDIREWNENDDWNYYDLLISTIPIENIHQKHNSVIVVPPYVSDSTINKIRDKFKELAFVISQNQDKNLYKMNVNSLDVQCLNIQELVTNIKLILDYFDSILVEDDITFDNLIRFISRSFVENQNDRESLYNKLIEREKISSQIIPEMQIALLHCKTNAVKSPIFSMISPIGEGFTDAYFNNVKSCLVMLIPENSSKDVSNLMGCVSSKIIEEEGFLDSIVNNNKEKVYLYIQDIFREYIKEYVNKL